ncbi:immunity 63 family protein [Pseudomonas monsensis]|uniref:Immunity 63 family protein n=1 Tax=Pseudomonas monsensis TaxID=2745509 RepID=A0ABT3YNY3_9PSED|nr:Imm63 family immunity protein [Pseudomonas monsensis]MCY0107194.1 immunity 63 family protein [Pseudomonas monsensis]
MVASIHEIQSIVYELGGRINAPKSSLIVLSAPADDGAPYVEVHDDGYSYVSSERGFEIYNKSTESLDELLYWIVNRAVRQMAVKYELDNRVDKFDTRRVYFSRLVQLLGEIKPEWAELARQEVDAVLKSCPYVDG